MPLSLLRCKNLVNRVLTGEFANAADQLDAMVKSYMDENNMKKSEFAKAYAAVAKTDNGKALINKSYKGE
jgi:hypothetical protein